MSSTWGLWFRGTGILRLWEIGTAIILQKTCCLYTILAGFDLVLRLVLWAHHCLRRPSGGPAGGYCRSSADPVACGAPRASAAKDRCTFLACGAQHLLAATLWIHSFETVRRRPERCTYLVPRLREARRRRRGLPRIGSSRRQAPRRAAGGNGEPGAPP